MAARVARQPGSRASTRATPPKEMQSRVRALHRGVLQLRRGGQDTVPHFVQLRIARDPPRIALRVDPREAPELPLLRCE
eukprot:13542770-Alexandrium_andersonii.AAC.1